jgi:DNA-binding NtrC family response regulator
VTAEIARVTEQGLAFRDARFVPLGADACLVAVVAILDSPPAKAPELQPGDPRADDVPALHDELRRFRREVALRRGMDCLAGASPATRRALAQAQLAAGSTASVLLVGPPGSGRRRLAEAIHYGDAPASAGRLLPLDCALLDSESLRWGLRTATPEAPGTVLLLDADRLSPELQTEIVDLVRPAPSAGHGAPEGYPARPLNTRPPSAAFRLIATAQTTLAELVRHGHYREDLAAWLSTITIELPSLVQRRHDIPLLAQALLEEGNARGGKQLAGFTPEALDRLDAYAWPGNIDELARAVAEARQRASGPQITAADLPERLHLAAEAGQRPRRKEETVLLDEFVAHIQRELIRRALARAKGNKAKAARLLGLNRPRLYRRMAQLGLLGEE